MAEEKPLDFITLRWSNGHQTSLAIYGRQRDYNEKLRALGNIEHNATFEPANIYECDKWIGWLQEWRAKQVKKNLSGTVTGRTTVSKLTANRIEPGPDAIVHLLTEGRTPCGMPTPPSSWADNVFWVGMLEDKTKVNCPACKAWPKRPAAAYIRPPALRKSAKRSPTARCPC